MSEGSETRAAWRVECRVDVEIVVDPACVHAATRNISLSGMFIETDVSFKENSRVRLSFTIPTQTERIVAEADVRWVENGGIGVRFVGLRARDAWALGRFLGGIARTGGTP